MTVSGAQHSAPINPSFCRPRPPTQVRSAPTFLGIAHSCVTGIGLARP
jgi:hypothetical protein